jgi:predicted molibdopterin-dependent oxidoreductase YjgC
MMLGGGDAAAVSQATGVSLDQLNRAAEALGQDTAVVTTHAILNEQGGKDTIAALRSHKHFNCLALGANDQGAIELGLQRGRTTEEILRAAAEGSVRSLWLAGCDPINDFHDRSLATQALERADFVVVQDVRMTDSAHYASVVLPMAAPAEHDGTYTNCERRVQRMAQAIPAPGEAKPAWRIFSECMVRASDVVPFFNPDEVLQAIAREHASFAKQEGLDGEGFLLGGTE